ncbi:preprotein translocase subunit YajC [Bombilactobacillus bombi]|uniref:preprotein translocase subunit YajC n=1 Tax=Bombilactobacillus bombi TaxID=1303590 RepID=UPI00359C4FAF
MFFIIIVFFALMYFTMYRPQKKQQQKRQEMLNQIKVGDPVVTIGGLHGNIDSLNDADKTVVLDCDGIYLTFSRSAIRSVATTSSQPAAPVSAAPGATKEKNEAAASKAAQPTAEDKTATAATTQPEPTSDADKAEPSATDSQSEKNE